MEELYKKLNAFPDAYFGFVIGVITYAKQKPERVGKILEYLDSSENLSTSDIIKFISDQPDFHDFCASSRQQAEEQKYKKACNKLTPSTIENFATIMDELYKKLNTFTNAHFAFVMSVIKYVQQNPECLENLMEYLKSSDGLSKSDVIHYISIQPDFFDIDDNR